MASRDLAATEITEGIRLAIWEQAGPGGLLEGLDLKSAVRGDWQIPADDPLAGHLPVVIAAYRGAAITTNRPGECADIAHTVEVEYLRLLGDEDSKDDQVVTEAQLIANLFLQGKFRQILSGLPAGVAIKELATTGFEPAPGFILDEISEIESIKITITIEAAHYSR